MSETKPLVEGYFINVPIDAAVKLGINETLFLSRLHYWLQLSNNEREGFKWVYKTIEEWGSEFPFWSDSTIKRLIKDLKNRNLLIVANYNKMKMDRTIWYRIDYKTLYNALGQVDTMESVKMTQSLGQVDTMESVKMTPPITKEYTNNKTNNISVQQAESLFDSWWDLYGNKKSRAKCEPKFKQLVKKYGYEKIEEGTKRYLKYLERLKAKKEFVPNQKYPFTFLNQESFLDEYELEPIEQLQQSSYPPRLESADTIDFSKGEDW